MKFYRYAVSSSESYILSEDEIIDSYFSTWSKNMKKVGKGHLITRENCIEDWVIINWASEVQILTEE